MGKKSKNPCYFCGGPGVSTEHAPAKITFRSFVSDKIKVPSCEEHNSGKSDRDRLIILFLLRSLEPSSNQYPHRSDEVKKAIAIAKKDFKINQNDLAPKHLIDPNDGPGQPNIQLPYVPPDVRLADWMRMLTAALIWDVNRKFDSGNAWQGAECWSPMFVPSPDKNLLLSRSYVEEIFLRSSRREARYQFFEWIPGWASGPNNYPRALYRFQYAFKGNGRIVFEHRFFSNFSYFVDFIASHETRMNLRGKSRFRNSSDSSSIQKEITDE